MKFCRQLLLIFLLVITVCLGSTDARIKQSRQPRSESEENRQSIFDVDSDTDSEVDDYDHDKKDSTEIPESDQHGSGRNSRQIELPKDYSKLEIPRQPKIEDALRAFYGTSYYELMLENITFPPMEIDVDIKIRGIRNIDELEEEITVELDFITKWVDTVILFENKQNDVVEIMRSGNFSAGIKSLDPIFLKRIWKPDIFIENVVSISRPELITKPIRLLYSPSGFILFSTRVTVTMDCEMEFHYYPADTQSCIFKIRSYSYTTKDMTIIWDNPGPFLMDASDHNFDVKLDLMETEEMSEAEGLVDDDYKEVYAILQFKISARRKLSFHLIQTYLPSAFFIIITWLSYLVPTTMVEARIGISMTTLLTLTSMFSSVRENTPIVSYVKAIDIWMVACIFFVFITLLEFTLLTWRRHLKPDKLVAGEAEPPEIAIKDGIEKHDPAIAINNDGQAEGIELEDLRRDRNKRKSCRRRFCVDIYLLQFSEEDIEKYGFFAFSLLFVFFNIVYWPWLLVSSKYFEWSVDPRYNAPM